VSDGSFVEIEHVIASGLDADDVLRGVVAALVREPGVVWAGILFEEEGTLALGPEAGVADPGRRAAAPVVYRGAVVGELAVDGTVEPALLERVAELIATHVLLGWDTGGERWEP
jgi:hypothetical protein